MTFWRKLPVAKKLYVVIGAMAILIVCELAALNFAIGILSAVRAFVGGEGLWSKSQKNAAFHIQRYGLTRNEQDYRAFLEYLQVPEGDHIARTELEKPDPDLETVRKGFLQGRVHSDDIPAMIALLQRFSWEPHLAYAIQVWREGDEYLQKFREAGERYHSLLQSGARSAQLNATMTELLDLNQNLTRVEDEFSKSLGDGSRWLENFVLTLVLLAVLTVEIIGLTLTFLTTRSISRGLAAINVAAIRIGDGDFKQPLSVDAEDEIGTLARSVERMRLLLDQSYGEMEGRVKQRTAELESMASENKRLYQQAEAAVQMRDEFISVATHELKSPLTSLELQLQMLQRKIVSPDLNLDRGSLRAHVDRCIKLGKRLTLLGEELLDLTRIRAGKLNLRFETCDLVNLALDSISDLSVDASKTGSEINLRTERPVIGDFDPLRISQIITNLLTNAIKYGRGNSIDVFIGEENGSAFVEVRDRGIGMTPEFKQRVFDRFERGVDESISGLGLGLFITRQLVSLHGGTIRVESELDVGSTFRVELPTHQSAQKTSTLSGLSSV